MINTTAPDESGGLLSGDLLSEQFIKDNVLSLRRRFKLSQGEFVARYLSDESGNPIFSVSKFSNFETKGGKDSQKIAQMISLKLSMDVSVFYMDPERFAKNIDLFLDPPMGGKRNKQDINDVTFRENHVATLVRVISDYLFEGILSGELHTGAKLPSDRSLATTFGTGRTAIREALKVLSVLGLLDILPGQGTFITSDTSNFFTTPLSWAFLMGERNVNHIIDVRNVLEGQSARLAAQKATEDDLRDLTDVFERSSEAYLGGDFQNFLDLDLDFHITIAKCSQNPIIQSLLLTSRKLIRYISKSGMVNLSQLNEIFEEHSAVYNAILSHDASDAEQKMNYHLEKSRTRYQINK